MPLIYPPHDHRRHDSRLFKGGDGGAGDMRRQEEDRQAKVQAAVDAINAKFGIAPSGGSVAAPTREQFTTKGAPSGWVQTGHGEDASQGYYTSAGPDVFDEAGYNKALQAAQRAQVDVSGAKTARDAMYADISGAVRDTAMRDLDRQYSKASQANKFGLARSGLLGSSVDAESGGELATLYGEGKLKAAQAGEQAAAELRGTDERTRQNLIGLAQSGLDTGTAASMAAGQMEAAANVARNQTAGATVGDLFGNLSQAYLQNQVLKARYPNGLPQQTASAGYGNSNLYGSKGYVGKAG